MAARRWRDETALGSPGQVDARAARRWLRYVRPLVRLFFRPRLEGTEHLPQDRPYMLVANHSGGGNAEIMSLAVSFLERQDTIRPIASMVHPLSFNAWPHGVWMKNLGAIPSTYPAARAAFAAGVPVLVFPGGDHEAQRPVWQANQVQFAGRKGFLKIARDAQVPVVPLGIRGSHYTAPNLWRSDRVLPWLLILPRVIGMKRYALTLLGALGAALLLALGPMWTWWLTAILAWLWLVLPFATLPWIPWPIRIRIGKPIPFEELFPDTTDATLDRAYERVQGAVQALVTARA
jgi:1-acyl-sn-glycerol-3-phosphate acyltransferase